MAMNIIVNWLQFKVTITLTLTASGQTLWRSEARKRLLLSCEISRWHILSTEGHFLYMENLLFSTTAHTSGQQTRSNTAPTSYTVTSPWSSMERASFLLSHELTSAVFERFSAVSSSFATCNTEDSKGAPQIRLWLKYQLGFHLSPGSLQLSPYQ